MKINKKTDPTQTRFDDNRVVVSIVWLLAWPALGVVAFIVVALVLGWMTFVFDGDVQSEESFARIFLVSIGILAVGFFTLAWRMSKKQTAFNRIGAITLRIYTSFGLLLGVYSAVLMTVVPNIEESNSGPPGAGHQEGQAKHVPTQNPELLSILKSIGAKHIDDLDIDYADALNNENWSGQYNPYVWDNDDSFAHGEIKILQNQPNSQELFRTVAHEYLHHIWESRIDRRTQENLTSHLITLHGQNSYMQQRVRDYSHQGRLLPTEIFAFACTEFSDGWLSEYVVNQCNTYINRNSLQMVF